ncbi:MAG: hypothetical protein LCH46_07260 [Proteobacteria bacterium]|nr:hypothetical protein [Pseudomonadota bacterium]
MTSSQDISGKIAALDAALAQAEQGIPALSYDAVGGDAESAEKLAKLLTKIAGMKADRGVLEAAFSEARRHETAEQSEADAADRAAHLNAAKGHAKRMLDLALRADGIMAEFAALFVDSRATNQVLHNELKAAGIPANAVLVGRHDLPVRIVDAMSKAIRGGFKNQPDYGPASLGDVARSAFADLIVEEIQ